MRRMMAAMVLTVLSSTAGASVHTYTANLTGPNEFPVNASPGTGFTSVIYDDVAHKLRVNVAFQGLLGDTTASHIHCCVSPAAADPRAGVATETPTFENFP